MWTFVDFSSLFFPFVGKNRDAFIQVKSISLEAPNITLLSYFLDPTQGRAPPEKNLFFPKNCSFEIAQF